MSSTSRSTKAPMQSNAQERGNAAPGQLIGYPPPARRGNAATAEKLAGAPRLYDPQAYTHISSDIDPERVGAAAEEIWNELSGMLVTRAVLWEDTTASQMLFNAVRDGKIRAGFDTGWIDDGYNDTLDLGLLDVDVRVKADLYIANASPVAEGPATFGSSTAGSMVDTRTVTTTGGGQGSMTPGGMGGNASGNVASAEAMALGTTETNAGSMVLPAVLERADALLEIEISMNHSLNSPIKRTRMVDVGTIFFKRLALY